MTKGRLDYKRLALLAFLFILVWWWWSSIALFPLRILVTLFHEFGHGLAAFLTGGEIVAITIDRFGGGVCTTRGGWRWVVLPAGYIGSMVAGCVILLLAGRTRHDKIISLTLGLTLIVATVWHVRTVTGLVFGLLSGATLASAGWWLPEDVNDIILSFIGTTSCLYALLDLRYLLSETSGQNDAAMFSKEILPLPPIFWAVIWGVAAVACLVVAVRYSAWTSRAAPARPRAS